VSASVGGGFRISSNMVDEFGVEFVATGKAAKLQGQYDLLAGIVRRGSVRSQRLVTAVYYMTGREDFPALPDALQRVTLAGLAKLGYAGEPDVFRSDVVVAQSKRRGASKRLAGNLSVVTGQEVTQDDLWRAIEASRPADTGNSASVSAKLAVEGEGIE